MKLAYTQDLGSCARKGVGVQLSPLALMSIQSPEIVQTTPRPALLDVVRLESQWCQVVTDPNSTQSMAIKIEDGAPFQIKWNEWELIRRFGLPIREINNPRIRERLHIGSDVPFISPSAIQSIHWGPEEKTNPNLKGEVTLFGFYKRRPPLHPK